MFAAAVRWEPKGLGDESHHADFENKVIYLLFRVLSSTTAKWPCLLLQQTVSIKRLIRGLYCMDPLLWGQCRSVYFRGRSSHPTLAFLLCVNEPYISQLYIFWNKKVWIAHFKSRVTLIFLVEPCGYRLHNLNMTCYQYRLGTHFCTIFLRFDIKFLIGQLSWLWKGIQLIWMFLLSSFSSYGQLRFEAPTF
jgi:hypothetical protein